MKQRNVGKAMLMTVAAVLFFGCASTYNPPHTPRHDFEQKVDAPKAKIYSAAMFALRRAGFRFAFADLDEGRITTRPRSMKLNDRDCDCGMGAGRGFASDERTTTDMSYFVLATDGGFTLRCIIEGRYVASDTSMVKQFQCVSHGVKEKEMIQQIVDGISASGAGQTQQRASPPEELPPPPDSAAAPQQQQAPSPQQEFPPPLDTAAAQ
jgi:hypothetical protein